MAKGGATLGPTYYALALQTAVQAVNGCADRGEVMASISATTGRLAGEIRAAKAFVGDDLKLIVLPEYALTSYPTGESVAGWAEKAALDEDCAEYDALGKIARDNDLFLCVNAYERDANFPDLYFQACIIFAPSGEQILRYRRLNSMFAPTPHDVWDKYLDIYGLEDVFPVAKTEIGNLAAIASEEILYPEIARCLALRGAEVFLQPTGEMGCNMETPKSIARRARATENMAYVVSANAGGILDQALPESATDGRSSITDYRGLVLAESGWGQTISAHAAIDLNALRGHRRRPGMANQLSRQRLELFAETYATLGTQPANALLEKDGSVKTPERSHFGDAQAAIIAKLAKSGRI